MRDVAKNSYENCEIGETRWIRPDLSRGETLDGFQSVLLAAQVMQENGKILIETIHRESQTGHSLVDAIMFIRVK